MGDETPDYGPQDYVPRWRVRLIIRFDEFGNYSHLQAKVPAKPTKSLNGTNINRTDLVVTPDPMSPPGTTRYLLQGQGTTTFGTGQQQASSSDGLTQVVEGIVPMEFKWSQNGIRTADTLMFTCRLIDLPIDPRTVRSIAVVFLLGTIPIGDAAAEVFAGTGDGGGGTLQGSPGSSAQPAAFLPETWTDGNGQQRTNVRFQGWVDKWTVEWSDENDPVLRCECRDNTQLFLTQHAPPALNVAANLPIDKAFAQYLTHFPQFAGLSIEYRPPGTTPPALGDVLAKSAYRPHLGPPPSHGGGGTEQLTVWDYFTDCCRAIGHGLRIEGTTLVIQRTRALTSSNVTARGDDPFKGRRLPGQHMYIAGTSNDPKTLQYRQLIWGRNLFEMRCERNLTKNAPQNIEVRSYNSEQKQILVGRFPLPADRQVYAIPGDATPDQKWLVLTVPGVKDAATLKVIAQEVYENLGRNELTWELRTINFASFGGDNGDPDLLDMRPGDPLEVLVARDEQASSTTTATERDLSTQARNAQRMKDIGFDAAFADQYAKTYTDANFPSVFRVKQMDVNGSIDDGVEFGIQAVNYVEVRADKQLDGGQEPAAAGASAPPATPATGPQPSGPPPTVGG